MKKYLMSVLVFAAALSLAGCSSTGSNRSEAASSEAISASTGVISSYAAGTPAAELADLYNGGYTTGCMTGNAEGTVVVNFCNEDHTDFKQAVCTMTLEEKDAFFSIDWMAEDYCQQCFDALAACEDLAVITPSIPDMTEYKAMEGKTIGELEDAGFEFAAWNKDAEGQQVLDFYICQDDDTAYTLRVVPDIAEDDETIYDDETIKAVAAREIIFWDFD